MPANPRLIRRSVGLKRALLAFAEGAAFRDALRQAEAERFGGRRPRDEGAYGNFLDYFILQRRLEDGSTVVERFVAAHPELREDERRMLLGGRDVVEGLFEVQERRGEGIVVVNLVDDLTYRVRSNAGPAFFTQTPPGSFFIGRLAPVEDEWLLSGYLWRWPASERDEAYRAAGELAMANPALLFRNPEKLEQGWDLQRREVRSFRAFFGSDLVVIPGRELQARMSAYWQFRLHEYR